ncbi:hypothetical protein [Micromonospora tulbaghiae]|uniref:hypothetical protein n=1 Tax=Micromonospora tulbaghiae TaxID=479978 RepID=UPI003EBD0E47
MRFSTDDGLFGFVVTPLIGSGMYRFQLVVHGELVGDTEPCFLESAMGTFGRLHQLDDSRLGQISADASSVMATIDSDDMLHDSALLSVAESLDGWKIRGYVYEGDATVLAQRYMSRPGGAEDPILVSIVPLTEYCSVFDASYDYWAKTRYGKE